MNRKIFCHSCGQRLIEAFIKEENKNRLFCTTCNKPIYENPVPSTAAVVLSENNEILLVQRKVEPNIGEWCLPGGFLEMDETPEEGCLRELLEETGLHGEIDGQAGNMLSKSVFYRSVIVMGYIIKNTGGTLIPNDDCLDAQFFPLNNMPRIAFKSHQTIFENALKSKGLTLNKSIK